MPPSIVIVVHAAACAGIRYEGGSHQICYSLIRHVIIYQLSPRHMHISVSTGTLQTMYYVDDQKSKIMFQQKKKKKGPREVYLSLSPLPGLRTSLCKYNVIVFNGLDIGGIGFCSKPIFSENNVIDVPLGHGKKRYGNPGFYQPSNPLFVSIILTLVLDFKHRISVPYVGITDIGKSSLLPEIPS